MTKKNAKKGAARARKDTLGGKYQHHLRLVGGGGNGDGGSGFFGPIANAIRSAFPALSLSFDLPNHAIVVQSAERRLVVCTARNEPPKWPIFVLLPETPNGDRPSWECETINDLLTVLRWPQAHPHRHWASVNEIRDTFENDSKHAWEHARDVSTPMMVSIFQCRNCRARLLVDFGEKVEDVARTVFANWHNEKAGRQATARTLSRGNSTAPIPPRCPGQRVHRSLIVFVEGETSEHAGAGSMFQIVEVQEGGREIDRPVDHGIHFSDAAELERYLAQDVFPGDEVEVTLETS